MSNSKRKTPPVSSPATAISSTKRQRLSPATASRSRAASSSRAQSPLATAASPGGDSLSSLTDSGSRGSSPEIVLASAVKGATSTTSTAGAAGGTASPKKKGREKKKKVVATADSLDRVVEEAVGEHPAVSAKSAPSGHPGTSASGRPTQGGKGQRGEEALEHAVAAREEVERRRAQLKEANGVGVAGAWEVEKDFKAVKIKTEEQEEAEVEVVRGEEAEELVSAAPPRKERPALAEERAGIIRFVVVTNDTNPESMIILTGLKNIFQKQLPKMPREYIARLVFDRAHWSMAIVKRGLEVVGGITYRPFEGQKFAEIVFCAITGTEQVKGYGSHLMNHLKDHVKTSTKCMHFLTYADNYAIGYFKKQGFTKEIQLERSVWAGYIKDYEGGTIMHCAMLPRINYLDVASTLAKQKEIILAKIRQLSQSHVVHSGLSFFVNAPPGSKIDPSKVPGLKESGWTPEMDELTRRPKRGPQFAVMKKLLTLLVDHPSSWAFANPVNAEEVTDYYTVIKEPMDLATMETKLEANSYDTLEKFLYDAKLVFNNCRQYNDSGSNYVKNANKLETYLDAQVRIYSET
ncbi:hypothetical protein JCM11641_002044 [Rhodosporidiobolus odoratus]